MRNPAVRRVQPVRRHCSEVYQFFFEHALLGEVSFVDNDSVFRPRLKACILQLVFCHLRVAENGLKLVADQEKTGEAQTVCFSWATAAVTFCFQVTGFQISNDRRKGYLVSGGCLRFLVAPSS